MTQQAFNPERALTKEHMLALGIKTKKAYRKYQKKARRIQRETSTGSEK